MDRSSTLQNAAVEIDQSSQSEGLRVLEDIQLAFIGGGIADIIGV